MTKQQAIAAMEEGNKVTHRFFSSREWVALLKKSKDYITEDGCMTTPKEFWAYRTGEYWERDWEIWEAQKDPQPAALIPADITPGEWVQGKRTDTKEWMQIFAHDKIVAEVQPINKKGNRQQGDFDKEDANVKAICTAVNSTYKKGLNPEAFEEVVNIAIRALSFVADLNGSDWIKGEGAGELDMKQRAKSLQQLLYNATQKAKL